MEAYKGRTPDSPEGRAVAAMKSVTETLEGFFTDAALDAGENYQAAGEQKNTTREGGVDGNKYSIREGMTDQERYEELRHKQITVISDCRTADYSGEIASLEALETKAKSKAEKIIKPLAKKLGIINMPLSTTDVETTFLFTTSQGLSESLHKQIRYGGSYVDFAKTLINLDNVLKSAILIEAHGDKYAGTARANEHLEAVYVLFGAFKDGNSIIPVQMEIKKTSDIGGRLYLTVAMTKIEAGVVGSTPGENQARSLLPASEYNLADIFSKINPKDGHFLKYLPDGFLNEEQIQAKKTAIGEDEARISGYKNKAPALPRQYQDGTAKAENRPVRVPTDASETRVAQAEDNVKEKFSDRDSDGNTLSQEQSAFFAQSKIRDANGSLKVMHHGSAESFTIFDKKKARSSGYYGKGFYFTDSASHARQYGNTYDVYLNITNPLQGGTKDITKAQLRKFVEAVAENEDYGIENYGYGATVDSVVRSVYGKSDFAMIMDINASSVGDMVAAIELFNEVNGTDYNGIVAVTETVAFYPEQIKNVDNRTPTSDPDIRFSERNPELEKVNRVLEKENIKLKADVSYLKEMVKLQKQVTGGTKFTKTSVEAAAGQLMRYAGAKGSKTELAGLLNSVYEYIAKGDELTWEGVKEAARPAVEWLQKHVKSEEQLDSAM